ncbi:MAG TPA: amino acid adenylation domain-containing protein [Micromonosporaceae bacterium]
MTTVDVDKRKPLAELPGEARRREELGYWTRKLGGDLPVLDLPRDRPRPVEPSGERHTVPLTVDADDVDRARRLAESEGATLFVVVLAAYKVFVARMSRQRDVIVGTSSSRRDDEIGPVALRTVLDGSPTFREVVRRVHDTVVEAHDHGSVPYHRIVAELDLPRVPGVHPVFQTFFTVQPPGEGSGGLADLGVDPDAAGCDLTVALVGDGGALSGHLGYAGDLFDEPTVARFAMIYRYLLGRLIAEPDQRVFEAPLLPPAERERILERLNPYRRPDIGYTTMAQPFEEQVRRTPDAVALTGDEGDLTYAELNARANRLARYLRGAGVRPGTFVALCLERSFAQMVALYAVTKLGAPYVPLDPELPEARIAFMLEDAAPAVVLVDRSGRTRIGDGPWQVVSVDEDAALWADQPSDDVPVEDGGYDLIHMLYTSGTTGRPKAVAYPVDGALADIFWLQRSYPFGPGDTAVLKTSYGFDVSIWEIFWPLYFGATVAICPPGEHRDPARLLEFVEKHRVTTMFMVPSMMQPFLDVAPPGSCGSLRWVFCGGEPVTVRIRDGFHARFTGKLINCYGPTEAGCVTDMVLPVEPGAPVPLGRPAANFRLYVLDENLEPTPVGVPGEVYIGGEIGIARCYHRRAVMTAERFVPDPYGVPGSRMYRTGDLCRYRDDGVLEHLGRIGRQVKVRGMRIELAEIEAVFAEHAEVSRCVATVVPQRDGEIAVFVVPAAGRSISVPALTSHAARLLPGHMMPTTVTEVDRIPQFVSGKIDFGSLLSRIDTAGVAGTEEVVAPADELEARLADIYCRVLNRDRVSVTESFFTLGGHSLLVLKLIETCAQELHVRPGVRDVFLASSVRQLAERVRSSLRTPDSNLVPIVPNPGRPMLVFVHAASGSVLPFFEVAGHLGDRFAVYGLQALPNESTGTGDTVEAIATRYVTAVDDVRDGVPVVLVGWSMGGCVALEMARQWHERGEDVVATLMLDTWAPPAFMPTSAVAQAVRDTILAMDVLGLEGAGTDGEREVVERLQRLVDRNRNAFLAYTPRFYPGAVHLLRASDPLPDPRVAFPTGYLDGDRGWSAYVGEVTTGEIHGNHHSLLDAEHAGELARIIGDAVAARATVEEP